MNSLFLGRGKVAIHDISGVSPLKNATSVSLEEIPSTNWNLITSMQVLEHVPYPAELLLEVKRFMSKETLLYVEVPHEKIMREDLNSDLVSKKRYWHEHINFFSESGVKALFSNVNLKILDILRLPINEGSRKGQILGVLGCLS